MICPKCKHFGLKSTVTPHGGMSTSVQIYPYYDEEGVYHYHDNNTHVMRYTCSKGHKIVSKGTGQCPNCTWGRDNKEVTVENAPDYGLDGIGGKLIIF